MADTPELLECRICGRRPATDRDRGRGGPCDAVARLQCMVHGTGSDLQVWMVAVVSSMPHGMADGLHALLYGPDAAKAGAGAGAPSRRPRPRKRRDKGKGKGGGPPPRRSNRDASTTAVVREVAAAAAEAAARAIQDRL